MGTIRCWTKKKKEQPRYPAYSIVSQRPEKDPSIESFQVSAPLRIAVFSCRETHTVQSTSEPLGGVFKSFNHLLLVVSERRLESASSRITSCDEASCVWFASIDWQEENKSSIQTSCLPFEKSFVASPALCIWEERTLRTSAGADPGVNSIDALDSLSA